MNLLKNEKNFMNTADYNELLKEAHEYVFKVLKNVKNNFLLEEDDELPQNIKYEDLRIEYSHTNFYFNQNGSQPFLRFCFYLYVEENMPLFQYDIEYNSSGAFADEYFNKY